MLEVYNSTGDHLPRPRRRYPYNPAFLCREDIQALGIALGEVVRIESEHDFIYAVAEASDDVRPGAVSLPHARGGSAQRDGDVRRVGCNTVRLVSCERGFEPIGDFAAERDPGERAAAERRRTARDRLTSIHSSSPDPTPPTCRSSPFCTARRRMIPVCKPPPELSPARNVVNYDGSRRTTPREPCSVVRPDDRTLDVRRLLGQGLGRELVTQVPIPTYFSHSYRLADQGPNQTFWRSFARAGFAFFVDPPSDTTIHTHLERMMRRCSAFVAVVNRRRDVSRFFCSRFVLYEYGLAIQARRPRLLLIDRRVSAAPFRALAPDETHFFSADEPGANQAELDDKIERLRLTSANFPNLLNQPRREIALLVPRDRTRCAYAEPSVLERIEEAADLAGFKIEVLEIPYEHNAFLALDLDEHEAVVLDVRGDDLPEWAFAYAYGRLVPTIKLVHVREHELPGAVRLPPLVEGLRMDETEPGVESVTYWRDPDDLVWQLARAFRKLDEEHTVFKSGAQGELYFESIGRRPARVFISNSGTANELGRRLSEALRLRNIEQFHYKEPEAIRAGSDWQTRILGEVQACNVFVALIDQGYWPSQWCREEMRTARARLPAIELLPYVLDDADVGFMDRLQVAELPTDHNLALSRVLKDVQERLTNDGDGAQRRLPPTTLLGASRESVIDAIRHVQGVAWPTLLSRLGDAGIGVRAVESTAPVRSREVAEQLFSDAQRATTGPNNERDGVCALVRELAELSPPEHQAALRGVKKRMAQRPGDDTP